jgi:hypothetical protein
MIAASPSRPEPARPGPLGDARLGLAWVTLLALPAHSAGPRGDDLENLARAVRDAGFDSVQCHEPAQAAAAQRAGLATWGLARVLQAPAVAAAVARARGDGHRALTLHLGHGFESEAEADALLDAVAAASQREGLPVWVETHRATLTQDPWRTLGLLARHPALWLTGDFSHWVAGCELRYGDLDDKLARLTPVFARTAMLHGRVAASGSFQVCSHEPRHAADLLLALRLWQACFEGAAARGQALPFIVELLPAALGYAASTAGDDGLPLEVGDRWQEALHLLALARRLGVARSTLQPQANA